MTNNERTAAIPVHVGENANPSRRGLFAIFAVAAVATLAAAPAAIAKMAQKAAGYQATPKGDQSCANCTLFKPPDSCTLVDGAVAAGGWCRFYSKKS